MDQNKKMFSLTCFRRNIFAYLRNSISLKARIFIYSFQDVDNLNTECYCVGVEYRRNAFSVKHMSFDTFVIQFVKTTSVLLNLTLLTHVFFRLFVLNLALEAKWIKKRPTSGFVSLSDDLIDLRTPLRNMRHFLKN